MEKNNTVITFGSHGSYAEAAKRLIQQAINLKLFDRCLLCNPEHLKGPFWERHHQFICSNPRGYGYWIWKPYIMQQTMQTMKDGDVLLYLDCGCELDVNKRIKLQTMLTLVERELFIDTIFSPLHDDESWTKYDLIDRMKLPMDTLKTPQRQAGALLVSICPKTRNLIDEWYELCCDYRNIDDSLSILPNAPTFVEHRHDQSVLSLLCKKHNLCSEYSLKYCIDYTRNRTGVTKLSEPKRKISMVFKR